MSKFASFLTVILVFSVAAVAQENVVPPPTPVFIGTVGKWHLEHLAVDTPVGGAVRVSVVLVAVGSDGSCVEVERGTCMRKVVVYDGSAGISVANAMNRCGPGAKSLRRRVLEKLITDGYLSGTIEGQVDIPTPLPTPVSGE